MSGIFVAGALANKLGSGGEAWVRMSWVRGLRELGIDTWFVEELDPAAEAQEQRTNWFRNVTRAFGLEDRAALLVGDQAVVGPDLEELRAAAGESVLVNISGHLDLPQLRQEFRQRVMVDIDPGFTQFWHAQGLTGAKVAGHDLHYTIGELIGTEVCSIPTAGIEWRKVRQPVVLSDWPVSDGECGRFTTIATWRGPFGAIEHAGKTYGLKVHEFRKFLALPQRAGHHFEIALDIHPGDSADLHSLREHGWEIVDPSAVAGDVESFRAYVRGSGAEFSVAQGVYVESLSGWFSDRTTRYLAAGRPALVQDTGFSRTLPSGDGLVPFTTLREAAEGAADIVARYEQHSHAARRIAEECFSSDVVLSRFCEEIGLG